MGSFHRTLANKLIYLGRSEKKFKSTIKCQDITSFATNDLSPGVVLQVGCIQRLWQKISGSSCLLDRIPLNESLLVINNDQIPIENYTYENQTLYFNQEVQGFVSYRPWLTMQIKDYTLSTDEWGLKVGWQLDLEEV